MFSYKTTMLTCFVCVFPSTSVKHISRNLFAVKIVKLFLHYLKNILYMLLHPLNLLEVN